MDVNTEHVWCPSAQLTEGSAPHQKVTQRNVVSAKSAVIAVNA